METWLLKNLPRQRRTLEQSAARRFESVAHRDDDGAQVARRADRFELLNAAWRVISERPSRTVRPRSKTEEKAEALHL
jgi:hypothetical protein